MQPALENMLKKRRDRSIATILGIKERECDPHLPDRAKRVLRKVILDQFNDYYEVVLDVAASLDTGEVTLNEHYLQKIDALYTSMDEIRNHLVMPEGRKLFREDMHEVRERSSSD